MCTVCGCNDSKNQQHNHEHSTNRHDESEHQHHHEHDALHHYGKGAARAHAPGLSQTKMIQIEQDILGKNNHYAALNRKKFADTGILTLNLVSSPGSGKTTLLTKTLTDLKNKIPLAVIEGDQETSQDAERIKATGVDAIQINTGKGCHLDAHQVGHAVDSLSIDFTSVLFIENVGNLVCPAAFDLGESHKVAILSVTEGEDKPIKYPDMFHAADLLLLNKIDLLPYLDFDIELCIQYAKQVNPGIQILKVSATSGEGMSEWYNWIDLARKTKLIGFDPNNKSINPLEIS